MDRKYNDLIGEILKEAGEKANYKGKGKPISKEYLAMDTFQHFQKIAKNAGYLPLWLEYKRRFHN